MKQITTSCIVGLGWGDEGKGNFTASLAKEYGNSLVVRYSGGHNAGHTVIDGGFRHVYSSFGSGSHLGRPTFTSKYCTIYPTAVANEYEVLKAAGVIPTLYVDPLTAVTTPYDVYHNQTTEGINRHGSVGVGLGATHARQEAFYKLHAVDLLCPPAYKAKLANIAKWYGLEELDISDYMLDIEKLKEMATIRSFEDLLLQEDFSHVIFEGSQGILLDQDFGFFPNVTRSHTTSRNAIQMITDAQLIEPDMYYITRAYGTRHGNGFMVHEGGQIVVNNEGETNVSDPWQGEFRVGLLSFDLIVHATNIDYIYARNINTRNIVVTCLDQVPEKFNIVDEDKVVAVDIAALSRMFETIDISNVYTCNSPDMKSIKLLELETA